MKRTFAYGDPRLERGDPSTDPAASLVVGEHIVLRASGPPEAEYALFEIEEIELRASEPGRVREHGYRTTAEQARARLSNFGMTGAVARELTLAMHPVVSDAYARGAAVRRVARYLGAPEVLQSDEYDVARQTYRGVFLDLAKLTRDLGLEHASCTVHALYLAAMLEPMPGDTTVVLDTEACMDGKKPGTRTFKRPSFTDVHHLVDAVRDLANKPPMPLLEEGLSQAEVIAFLRMRAEVAPDDDARTLYRSLENTVSLRRMPERGPLGSPDLWGIEMRIENGKMDGVLEAIDEAERRTGRTPGTTYLRARASLALRLEPAKLIAERVSALALSMTSFQELALLAAEAWLEAGDARRAMPYARDLIDSPGIDEALLVRAELLLSRTAGAPPHAEKKTIVDSQQTAPRPSRPHGAKVEPEIPPQAASSTPPQRSNRPAAADVLRQTPPPPLEIELPPADSAASFTFELPGPKVDTRPPARQTRPQRPRLGGVTVETRPPKSSDPRAEPDNPAVPGSTAVTTEVRRTPAPEHHHAAIRQGSSTATPDMAPYERPTPLRPPSNEVRSRAIPPSAEATDEGRQVSASLRQNPKNSLAELAAALTAPGMPSAVPEMQRYMHGASSPPYRLEIPAPLLTRAPLLPKLGGTSDELAEHLALPPGLGGEQPSLEVLPTSVLEARVQFTLLARELGLDYRLKRGVDLRADVNGIEAMQAVLLESFPDRTVKASDDAYELRRHGALLSEILARRLDAEWIDISPEELGYWAMIVPPDIRVWPFGRIARFIAMGHKERDLVSYYLELESRARPR